MGKPSAGRGIGPGGGEEGFAGKLLGGRVERAISLEQGEPLPGRLVYARVSRKAGSWATEGMRGQSVSSQSP